MTVLPTVRTIPATPAEALGTFVFVDGRPLWPTEIAALRILAAAGLRPRCVVAGTDRAPDSDAYRAALLAC